MRDSDMTTLTNPTDKCWIKKTLTRNWRAKELCIKEGENLVSQPEQKERTSGKGKSKGWTVCWGRRVTDGLAGSNMKEAEKRPQMNTTMPGSEAPTGPRACRTPGSNSIRNGKYHQGELPFLLHAYKPILDGNMASH